MSGGFARTRPVVLAALILLGTAPAAVAADTPTPTPTASTTPTPTPTPTPTVTSTPTPPPEPEPAPISTGSAVRSPSPSASGDKAPAPVVEPPRLSAAEIAAQIAKADDLWSRLTAANAQLAAAMKGMSRLTDRSNAILEELGKARDALKEAEAEQKQAESDLVVIQVELAEAQRVLRQWAYSAYVEGEDTVQMVGVLDAMAHDAAEISDPAGDLAYVTDQRLRAKTRMKELTAEQKVVTEKARTATAKAKAAKEKMDHQKAELDAAIAQTEEQIKVITQIQARALTEAGPVSGILIGANTVESLAAAARLREALGSVPDAVFSGGPACSGDESSYPNGALPPSALCPLYKAPGEALRPRAAAAFNALSQLYEKQTGSPICVTDSYRTYAEQVTVKAAKGVWAATPGTSHHGLGLALDLCGGINNFGTSAHLWMKQNAPLFGFYHPSWAEPGGPLPEPWHWEFAG